MLTEHEPQKKGGYCSAVFPAILAFLISASPLAEECKSVRGELAVWNGWPPNTRIHDKANDVYYGLPSEVGEGYMDDALFDKLTKVERLQGTFCLTLLGTTTTVPYLPDPIIMVRITKYEIEN